MNRSGKNKGKMMLQRSGALVAILMLSACGGAQDTLQSAANDAVNALGGEASTAALATVTDSAPGTPDGEGYVSTALADAQVAIIHADLTAQSTTIADMQMHAGHVLHAVDPSAIAEGPGSGYGLLLSSQNMASALEIAQGSEQQPVRLRAGKALECAQNTERRAETLIRIAGSIANANSLESAQPRADQMKLVARQLVNGFDNNGDGAISCANFEGGITQAMQQLSYAKQQLASAN